MLEKGKTAQSLSKQPLPFTKELLKKSAEKTAKKKVPFSQESAARVLEMYKGSKGGKTKKHKKRNFRKSFVFLANV